MDRDGQTTVNARNIGALRVEGDQYNYYYTLAEQTLKSNVEQPPVDVYVPRQAELAKLADALTTHAGVSLTSAQAIGEGRYGKTWLARAYAHQFRKDRYPGGIFEIRCGENASLLVWPTSPARRDTPQALNSSAKSVPMPTSRTSAAKSNAY